MTPSPLAKKLLIKPGNRVLLLNAPGDANTVLGPLPEGAAVATAARGEFDVVLLFAHHSRDLERHGAKTIKAVREGGMLWIAYPKKSAKVDTDLTRDVGWGVIEKAGVVGIAVVSIDATWSALRFRPAGDVVSRGGAHEEARRAAGENGDAKADDPQAPKAAKAPKAVKAPKDLTTAIEANEAARALWDRMAYSHRKEYVDWIEEAKKAETRARRVEKAVEMMASGQKDRNVKYRG